MRSLEVAVSAVRAAAGLCREVQGDLAGASMDKNDRSSVTVANYGTQAVICKRIIEATNSDHGFHQSFCQDLAVVESLVRFDNQAKYAVDVRSQASAYLKIQNDCQYRQKVWGHAARAVIVEEAGTG